MPQSLNMSDQSTMIMAFMQLTKALMRFSLLFHLLLLISCFIYGKADDDQHVPIETGGAVSGYDPAEIVARALLCFNDKYIYQSCEESYRLSETGNLKVPEETTDEYCNGPCLTETNLVLGCIDNIFTNFLFYNKATIRDVRDTIHAGCGYGPERGNFNVEEHIQAEENNAHHKLASTYIYILGLGLFIIIVIG